MVDLIKDVFKPVYKRVVEKKADLIGKQERETHGFEPSWFTPLVESVTEDKGLGPTVTKQGQEGADITFRDGTKLELKATPAFSFDWIIYKGALKHKAPVLFLCSGKDKNKINELKERPEVKVLHYKYLCDEKDDWILGLIDPIQSYIEKYQALKKAQKNYPSQLRKRGGYQDFDDLKDHLEKAPNSKITMCMDKALLAGRTYERMLKEIAIDKNRLRIKAKAFSNISLINSHIKYREDHNGWIFKYSGSPRESNTHVRLVGLRTVNSE